METLLEWRIVAGEHDLLVDTARQEEKRKTATIMEEPSDGFHKKQKHEEDMAKDRNVWRLGVDRRLLAYRS